MIRCSSIADIMTGSTKKDEIFGETAKKAMMEIVRESLFGVRKNLDDVKAIQKGKACEDAGIELYNNVFMYNLQKIASDGRRNNGIITGEPDLVAASSRKGVDIKIAWSLLTFPLTEAMADSKGYKYQAMGYMCLFDLPKWEIAYCAIDTPDELIRDYDEKSIHKIDSAIPMHHRITIVTYERCLKAEKEMLDKCSKANEWIEQQIKHFAKEHDSYII